MKQFQNPAIHMTHCLMDKRTEKHRICKLATAATNMFVVIEKCMNKLQQPCSFFLKSVF